MIELKDENRTNLWFQFQFQEAFDETVRILELQEVDSF